MNGSAYTWFTPRRGIEEALWPARWNTMESNTRNEPAGASTERSISAASSSDGYSSNLCVPGNRTVAPFSLVNGSTQKSALIASGREETKCW